MIAGLLPGGQLPEPWLWALRWILFLAPLLTAAWLIRHEERARYRVGALFAFLYGLGTIYASHQVAIRLGFWSYGGEALMLDGMPADILLGGALLFGPVLFLAAPRANPMLVCGAIVVLLHAPFLTTLPPFVSPGQGWLWGVVMVFLVAHLPALYLARWTAEDRRLGFRATLLAFGFGWLAFALLPALVMRAMGGSWEALPTSPPVLAVTALLLAPIQLVGATGAQMFVLRGNGTPVPLDPTDRLVGAGIYAYLCNPMQLCTALTWIVMGAALGNPWVMAMAGMAWIFVKGMVRWHHRHDLLVRFPEGWPEYRAHVPEWRPRWRPWRSHPARLTYDASRSTQRRLAGWLAARASDLEIVPGKEVSYSDEEFRASGAAAFAWALGHVNLATTLFGAALLLLVSPVAALRRAGTPAISETRDA